MQRGLGFEEPIINPLFNALQAMEPTVAKYEEEVGRFLRLGRRQAHDHGQSLIRRIRFQFHSLVVRKGKWLRMVRIIASNKRLQDFVEEEDSIAEAERAIDEGEGLDEEDEEVEAYDGGEETYEGQGDDDNGTSSEVSVLTRLCGPLVQDDVNTGR